MENHVVVAVKKMFFCIWCVDHNLLPMQLGI